MKYQHLKKTCNKFLTWVSLVWILLAVVFHFFNYLSPLNYELSYSTRVYSSEGKLLSAYLSEDDKWRFKNNLTDFSPLLQEVFLQKEDKYFYYHGGFNPIAIARAGIQNLVSGKRKSGASTITMQVVRLLHPKKRTIGNKLIEVFRATQLELTLNKREILEMYLNIVPYGGNIEGVGAASFLYLQKKPDELSFAEAVLLSVIPNRPTTLKLGEKNEKILEARNKWILALSESVDLGKEVKEVALLEPLNLSRYPIPNIAPHLSRLLKAQNKNEIKSTIKYEWQIKAEKLVESYSHNQSRFNIRNASVMVLDNATGKVVCYVGSQNFSDYENAGQVDGTRGTRSPGSTLKPFIYGMAIDQGLYTAKTIVTDVPININGYSPQNYEKTFYGNVSVEYALGQSLNIPAVKCLNELSPEMVKIQLKRAGFRNLFPKNQKAGLAMALGGCGVTMHELLGMYACLARGGVWKPISLTQNQESNYEIELMSTAASFLVTQILSERKRPDFPSSFLFSSEIPKIAWKTGTSFGRKDAWSIGYSNELTIAVWLGNFDGEGVSGLSGADVATPLLFELFNTLGRNQKTGGSVIPDELEFRDVCPESGNIPGKYCNHIIRDLFIPGISPALTCQHKKEFYVSLDSAVSYCRSCLPERGLFTQKVFPNYPSDLIDYWHENKIVFESVPPHNPKCELISEKSGPEIISLTDGGEYFFDRQSISQMQLKSRANNDVTSVYWYVNNKLFAKSSPFQPVFWKPVNGISIISVIDDKGRKSSVEISVTLF